MLSDGLGGEGRIAEARWLGEVQGHQVSLDAAFSQLANVDRSSAGGPTDLGMPIITSRPHHH